MEKLSENKKRRGRPKGLQAELIATLGAGLTAEGCNRTKMNDIYALKLIGALEDADPSDFRAVMGHSEEEMMAGCRFPKGYKTAANEIGRFMVMSGTPGKEVIRVVADARNGGATYARIAAHFRELRLGKRQGNVHALASAIIRAINEYQKHFAMTEDEIRNAIRSVRVGDVDDEVYESSGGSNEF